MQKDAIPHIKPYLKWAGGKRQLLPEIRRLLPPELNDHKYYEPFLGAGAVFFYMRPERAVISDANRQLMLTYSAIKNNVNELIQALKKHRENDSAEYFRRVRSHDRDWESFCRLPDIEKAARLIYLNKTCYNGLYRVNSRGQFNVPYGKYKNPSVCDEPALRAVHAYLAGNDITILHGDFASAVRDAGERSFIYFDPPYHSPGNTSFTFYQSDGFNESEQIRLRDVILDLTGRGAKCLLSNSDTPFIRDLYAGGRFKFFTVMAKRNINSDFAGRGAVSEVLIRNWG